MDKIFGVMNKYNDLPIRQRVIILLMVLAIFYMFWSILIDLPMDKKVKKLVSENAYLTTLYEEKSIKNNIVDKDKNTFEIERLNTAINKLTLEESELNGYLESYLSLDAEGGSILTLIKNLVDTNSGLVLEVVRQLPVENIPVVSKVDNAANRARPVFSKEENKNESVIVHKNKVYIRVKGSYASVTEYLNKIKSLDKGLFAQDIHYDATDYPNTITHIVLYTLSLPEFNKDA